MPESALIVGLNYRPESTGIAPYTSGLAAELARLGVEVTAVTGFPHYPQWRFVSGAPPRKVTSIEDGVRVIRRRHRLPRKPGGLARALSEVSFGFAAASTSFGKPSVIVLVSPALISSGIALLKARFVSKVPSVVWVQDLYTLGIAELEGRRSGFLARCVAALERWVLRSADAVVVIHDRFRDTVVRDLGVSPSRICVVRNWSHLDEREPTDRSVSRSKLGWNAADFVVLHAGNMGAKQGLENVVDAARLAAASDLPLRFVLVGDGNQRKSLENLAQGIPSLELLGSLDDADYRAAIDSADVLLVNERAGVAGMAVPSKLTSYFSTGLPVIAATDAGSVTESEVLLAGAGLVVPADDPAALVRAAIELADDPALASRFGANGRRFRAERLSPRASFDTFTQLLRELAARRGATRESGID